MTHLSRLILSSVLFPALCQCAAAQDSLPACPVMTDNQAVAEFYSDYRGLRYYFCCDQCVADFESDPSRFVELDSVQGFPIPGQASRDGAGAPAAQGNEPGSLLQSFYASILYVDGLVTSTDPLARVILFHLAIAAAIIFVPLIAAVVKRLRNRPSGDWGPSSTSTSGDQANHTSITGSFFRGAGRLVMVLLICDAVWFATRLDLARRREQILQTAVDRQQQAQLRNQPESIARSLLEQVHNTTLEKYGYPPKPVKQDQDRALSRVYYRGNDERHDQMFNGGQYRTVTFEIHLETESGTTVDYGSHVNEPLYLCVLFRRSADTSNGYFTSEYMSRMYLTMQAEILSGPDATATDRLSWSEVEPHQVWQARFPLPAGNHRPEQWSSGASSKVERETIKRCAGVVYLCEDRLEQSRRIGGRYHYAIEYDVVVTSAGVDPESDLFMGSTYDGRNFTRYGIRDEEWLSVNPIPEKPQPSDERLSDGRAAGQAR